MKRLCFLLLFGKTRFGGADIFFLLPFALPFCVLDLEFLAVVFLIELVEASDVVAEELSEFGL